MALVILGGLVTSTLLNLFVIPSLYLRFGNRGQATAAAQAEGILEYIKMEDSFAETLAKVEEAAGGPSGCWTARNGRRLRG